MNHINHRKKTLPQIFVGKIMPRFLLLWVAGYFAVTGDVYKLALNLTNESTVKYLIIAYLLIMFICAISIGVNAFYLLNPYLLNRKNLPRLIKKCIKEYEEQ